MAGACPVIANPAEGNRSDDREKEKAGQVAGFPGLTPVQMNPIEAVNPMMASAIIGRLAE